MLELNFQPFPVITSERLLMREISAADTDQVYKLRSDPTSMQFLDKAPLQDKEAALVLINRMLTDLNNNDAITWAVTLKDEPALLIGTIGYWRIDKQHYRAEIGYMLLPEFFNKGYMTEAINKVSEFAFNTMKVHSIEANINPENAASAAILLKSGFVKEAHFKENFYFDGLFKDSAVYSLLKSNT